MTRLVDDLEALGAVARHSDPANQRRNSLTLTPRARDLLGQCDRASQEVQEELRRSLSDQDGVELVKLLAVVAQHLRIM